MNLGIVEAVGSEVTHITPGDRVVIPFNISCGHCFMCDQHLYSQCETTQVRDQGKGASLLGYTKLYGQVPGGQAELLRVPQAHFGPIKVPEGPPDERFVYLSDVLPTAWQAVAIRRGARRGQRGRVRARADRSDVRPDRAASGSLGGVRNRSRPRAARDGPAPRVHAIDAREHDDIAEALRSLTNGRGPDSVIDAVGMEAHSAPLGKLAHQLAGLLPDPLAAKVTEKVGVDRLSVPHASVDTVRRGGTISLSGVYGGMVDPLPMMDLFDKQIQWRMGQANVKRWVDEIMPLLEDESDPLGVEDLVTHKLPLEEAPHAYEIFQKKQDGAIKILLQRNGR
jgi:threonine dehydrogenase-like Zn-dependent dehydrogenase